MNEMIPRHLHAWAIADWIGLVEEVPADAWDAPTPCAGWTVRDLVNHVTYEELWAAELFAGATLESVGERYDGDVLGDHPIEAARSAAAAAIRALKETTATTVRLSFGETPVDEYAAQLIADHLVHAWDLAAATGANRTLGDLLVSQVAAWFAEREETYRSAGAIGPRVAGTGDPQDDLLAAFGRDAGWKP